MKDAIVPWYINKKLTLTEYAYAKLSWEARQFEIANLNKELDLLTFEKEKLEQQIVELECDKETWFNKYHEKREEVFKLKSEINQYKIQLAIVNED